MFSQEFRIPVCIRLFMGDLLSIKRLALHNLKRTGGELIISVLYGSYYNFCKFVNDAFFFSGITCMATSTKDSIFAFRELRNFSFIFILFYFIFYIQTLDTNVFLPFKSFSVSALVQTCWTIIFFGLLLYIVWGSLIQNPEINMKLSPTINERI